MGVSGCESTDSVKASECPCQVHGGFANISDDSFLSEMTHRVVNKSIPLSLSGECKGKEI